MTLIYSCDLIVLTKSKEKVLVLLNDLYPSPKSELVFRNHYQLVISVVLSAQCTDKKVNQVTPALFKKFPAFSSLTQAKPSQVERIIRTINYYKTKSRNLIALAQIITDKHAGKLPLDFNALITLPGIGRKTANVILTETGAAPALPVDTHVFRVARRLGWANTNNVEKVEQELRTAFDQSVWRNLHHWLILHGRRVCKARRPLCSECKLASLCPSKQ